MGLVTYFLTYGAAFLCVVLAVGYLYFTRKFNHWASKGVKYIKPIPFIGNFKDIVLLRKNIGLMAKDVYEKHKNEPYIGLFAFDEPVLQIHDLDLVKAVLVKDFQAFTDRSVTANENLDPLPVRSLFTLEGDRWRLSRNALTPSFTSGKMKRMFELVSECGKVLVSMIEKENLIEKPVAIYELTSRYTADVIATCAFGIQGNTLTDPQAEFRRILQKHFEYSPKRAILMATAFFAPKILILLGMKLTNQEVEDFVRGTIVSTIREREKHQIKRNDLLDSLIQLKNAGSIDDADDQGLQPENKLTLEEEDVCAHSFAFLMAGFETTATTLSYMLYELAKNQDVQVRLRKKIQEAVTNEDFSYETLHSIKYLDMVIQETLRKYPPLPFVDRKSTNAYTLPGYDVTLEKGTRILLPMYGFHMDPEYHPHPRKFDPERFSEENKRNIRNYTYMPFSEGPRNCVGMRFAQMQAKSAIAHLLTKYSVHPCSNTSEEVIFNPKIFLFQPKDAILLTLRRLS